MGRISSQARPGIHAVSRYTWDKMADELRDNVTKFVVATTRGYDNKAIGARLKDVRQQRRATQTDASRRAGISMQTWSNIECGRGEGFQIKILSRVAKVMECDLIWLLHGSVQAGDLLTFTPEAPVLHDEDIPSPTIGKRLTMARKMRELSQHELAKAVGISQATVSQWERGHVAISRTRARILAEYLKVNVRWLETGDGPVETRENAALMRAKIKEAFGELLVGSGDGEAAREGEAEVAGKELRDDATEPLVRDSQRQHHDRGGRGLVGSSPLDYDVPGVSWDGF
jgi:transcriptional regulator with XRE-family HTH domain